MKQNIIVTGGAGYIGSHACKLLSNADFTPISVDNMTTGNEWAVKYGPLELGNVGDKAFMGSIFKKYNPLAVIHFAAYAYVGESMTEPIKYYANNVGETISLLQAMRQHGIDKIIFSSTCATYGIPENGVIHEADTKKPINPYGRSKLMIEHMLKDFHAAYGLNYAVLRYFNAGGADPDGEIGEKHSPETHLIPLTIQAALGLRPKLSIFGFDHDTPDGTPIRDYIHVCDLAQAHILILRKLLAEGGSYAYNLGSSQGYSVLEVVKAVEKICGRKIPLTMCARRPGDPSVLMAERSKRAELEMGWKPAMSSLEEIVRTAYDWHKKQMD